MTPFIVAAPQLVERLHTCKRCQFVWFDAGAYERLRESRAAELAEGDACVEPARGSRERMVEAEARLALAHHQALAEAGVHVSSLPRRPSLAWLSRAFPSPGTDGVYALRATLLGIGLMIYFFVRLLGGWRGSDLTLSALGFSAADPWSLGGLKAATSSLVHATFPHLLVDVWFLWAFGGLVETRYGYRRLLLVFLAGQFAGAIAFAALFAGPPYAAGQYLVGATGGISALAAYGAAAMPTARIRLLLLPGAWPALPVLAYVGLWLVAHWPGGLDFAASHSLRIAAAGLVVGALGGIATRAVVGLQHASPACWLVAGLLTANVAFAEEPAAPAADPADADPAAWCGIEKGRRGTYESTTAGETTPIHVFQYGGDVRDLPDESGVSFAFIYGTPSHMDHEGVKSIFALAKTGPRLLHLDAWEWDLAFEPPLAVLPAPVEVGAGWTWEGTYRRSGKPAFARSTLQLLARARYEGRPYDALHVRQTFVDDATTIDWWWAREVGLLAVEVREPGATTATHALRLVGVPPPRSPESERTLGPDKHPTPFSAADIRAACGPGRVHTLRTRRAGSPELRQRTTFLESTAEIAVLEVQTLDEAGNAVGDPTRAKAPWRTLQAHASWPKSDTQVAYETINTEAGRFDCVRYEVRGATGTVTAWFALDFPGPPVRVYGHKGEERVLDMEALEVRRP